MAKHEDDGGEAAPADDKKLSPKKLLIFGGAGLVLLLGIGGGAFVFLSGGEEKKPEAELAEPVPTGPKVAAYYNMPELVINLNAPAARPAFLKMSVTLQLESADEILTVQSVMPRIMDNLQPLLRELRPEDLRGSASLFRLREEMLSRIQATAAPAKVTDVLFSEVLVQ